MSTSQAASPAIKLLTQVLIANVADPLQLTTRIVDGKRDSPWIRPVAGSLALETHDVEAALAAAGIGGTLTRSRVSRYDYRIPGRPPWPGGQSGDLMVAAAVILRWLAEEHDLHGLLLELMEQPEAEADLHLIVGTGQLIVERGRYRFGAVSELAKKLDSLVSKLEEGGHAPGRVHLLLSMDDALVQEPALVDRLRQLQRSRRVEVKAVQRIDDLVAYLGGLLTTAVEESVKRGTLASEHRDTIRRLKKTVERHRRPHRRIAVVYAQEDLWSVTQFVNQMRTITDDEILFDSEEGEPDLENSAQVNWYMSRILDAGEVWLFWSKGARVSSWVLNVIGVIQSLLSRGERLKGWAQWIPVSGDETPVDPAMRNWPCQIGNDRGADVARRRVVQSRPTLVALLLLVALGLPGAREIIGCEPIPEIWALLITVTIAIYLQQRIGFADVWHLAEAVHRYSQWITQAKLKDILIQSDAILSRVYGDRLLSRASVRASVKLSAIPFVLPVIAWGRQVLDVWRYSYENPNANPPPMFDPFWLGETLTFLIVILGSQLMLNLLFDMLSVGIVRMLIRSAAFGGLRRESSSAKWPVTLCFMIVGTASLCALAPFVLNVPIIHVLSRDTVSMTAYTGVIFEHARLLATFGLHPISLLRDATPPFYVSTVLSIFIAPVGAGVFIGLMVGYGADRLSRGRIASRASGALSWLARRPHGPMESIPIATVGLLILWWVGTVGSGQSGVSASGRGGSTSGSWVEIGACQPEAGDVARACRFDDMRVAYIDEKFIIESTEVSSRVWADVWDRSGAVVADRYSLPRWPSPYRESDLPVTAISWCDAARFANLRSVADGLEPVYCSGEGCASSPIDGSGRRAALMRCEFGEAVHWRKGANGYRLPTAAEWEAAARTCHSERGCLNGLLDGAAGGQSFADDWYADNSRGVPHPVGTTPAQGQVSIAPQALNMGGNVNEFLFEQPDLSFLDPGTAGDATNTSMRPWDPGWMIEVDRAPRSVKGEFRWLTGGSLSDMRHWAVAGQGFWLPSYYRGGAIYGYDRVPPGEAQLKPVAAEKDAINVLIDDVSSIRLVHTGLRLVRTVPTK